MKKLTLILFLILSVSIFALNGKVTKVSDGDSFFLKSGNTTYRVRMYGIDAPELAQKHGEESKRYLENMILDKVVNIKVIDDDKYGRKVGQVSYKNKDINLEMLKGGYAWLYEFYAKNEKKYVKAFKEAQKEKRGIWKYKDLENPREYRKTHKREG